jgi:hypothetical protein
MTYVKRSFIYFVWVIYLQLWAIVLSVALHIGIQTLAPTAFDFVLWRAFVYGNLIYITVYSIAWLFTQTLRTLKRIAWVWLGLNGAGLAAMLVIERQAINAWWVYWLVQHPYSVWFQTRSEPIILNDYAWMLVFFLSVAIALTALGWGLDILSDVKERLAQRALTKQAPSDPK